MSAMVLIMTQHDHNEWRQLYPLCSRRYPPTVDEDDDQIVFAPIGDQPHQVFALLDCDSLARVVPSVVAQFIIAYFSGASLDLHIAHHCSFDAFAPPDGAVLKAMVRFSHPDPAGPPGPVYEALIAAAPTPLNEVWFGGVLDAIQDVSGPVVLTRVRHQLSNLLQPLTLDWQGLVEVGFAEQYWNETVHDWPQSRRQQLPLALARLLNEAGREEDDTLDQMVRPVLEAMAEPQPPAPAVGKQLQQALSNMVNELMKSLA